MEKRLLLERQLLQERGILQKRGYSGFVLEKEWGGRGVHKSM